MVKNPISFLISVTRDKSLGLAMRVYTSEMLLPYLVPSQSATPAKPPRSGQRSPPVARRGPPAPPAPARATTPAKPGKPVQHALRRGDAP
jgi:hypothetical protein